MRRGRAECGGARRARAVAGRLCTHCAERGGARRARAVAGRLYSPRSASAHSAACPGALGALARGAPGCGALGDGGEAAAGASLGSMVPFGSDVEKNAHCAPARSNRLWNPSRWYRHNASFGHTFTHGPRPSPMEPDEPQNTSGRRIFDVWPRLGGRIDQRAAN